MTESNKRSFETSFFDEDEDEDYLISASIDQEIVNKKEFTTNFFEEEDEDYLISASMEIEKDQGIISFDDFMNHKEQQPSSFDYNDNNSEQVQLGNSFLDAVESMDIDDNDPLFLNKETDTSAAKPTEISSVRETIHYKKTQTEISYTPEYIKPKIDYTKAPTTGSFVMATCPRTGKTLYLPKQTQAKSKNKKNDLYKQIINQSNKGNLLPTPISTLMKNIERQNQEKLKNIERY
ncbi:hypothetical protein G6F56_013006 [Rhizopus delemar]|nr:hypothetical protein G6F56_013006 [Rhizopus delemar]